MATSSLAFLVYGLPACIVLYYLCFFSRPLQNGVLLLASLLFYAFGQTVYLPVLLGSILWSWLLGLWIDRRRARGRGGAGVTWLAAAGNILPLAAFRLAGPGLELLCPLLGLPTPAVPAAAPLGLAFFTLQSVGYCVDVYRGEAAAERNPLYVGLYLSFFPKLTGGPLVDYAELRRQMALRTHGVDQISRGLCRFVLGLSKKVLLADQLAYLSDFVFNRTSMDNTVVQVPVLLVWLGLLALGLQIYYELSGYADMAVGLGLVFGFTLPEQFRAPFQADSLTDFWRRWNITGLGWFRKYLYGSMPRQENTDLVLRNLALVWLCFGLWHGFEWTFLAWGAWNFTALLAEHSFRYVAELPGRVLRNVYTLLTVAVGFVLLKSPTLYHAGQFFIDLLGLGNNAFVDDFFFAALREYWAPLLFGVLFVTPFAPRLSALLRRRGGACRYVAAVGYPAGLSALLALCLAFLAR